MPSVTLTIDGGRVQMISTGKVAPAHEWSDGKRSESQKRDPNTGMPVWVVDCLIDDDEASRATTAGVEVQALDEPRPVKFRPVEFVGLTANIYVTRAGALGMRFSAESIAAPGLKAAAS